MAATHCKNCGTELTLAYCPACGQKANIERISIAQLVKDLPHAIFHVDRGLLFNTIQLLKRPGKAILDYLEGKRKPFYHPVTFLVISLLVNYLVVKLIDLHFYNEEELRHMDPIQAQAIRDYDALQWWFLEHTYLYILLAIPVSSVVIYFIYKLGRQTFNLGESAVIVLFTIAEGVLLQSTLYLCFGWVDSGPFLRGMEVVNMIMLITYASVVSYQLLFTASKLWIRITLAILAGASLAVVWIASAYVLYLWLG